MTAAVVRECRECGRRRADGWVLVKGLCRMCGLDEWKARSDELLQQVRALTSGDGS